MGQSWVTTAHVKFSRNNFSIWDGLILPNWGMRGWRAAPSWRKSPGGDGELNVAVTCLSILGKRRLEGDLTAGHAPSVRQRV